MLTKQWEQFQSGTDIRGVASNVVEGEKINLTNEMISRIISAFSYWVANKVEKKGKYLRISLGHDSRISAGRISLVIMRTLTDYGIQIYNCGLASTPAMFMSVRDLPCDAAIQITASHHPFNRNGLKFFIAEGGLDSSDIRIILKYAQESKSLAIEEKGKILSSSYMKEYCAQLRTMIRQGVGMEEEENPLSGFRIIVDAGNGAGGFYATEVLKPLGANISGSQFLEPDGTFPNHIPNPEKKEAMDSICQAVLNNQADLGVIFDTDVDRGAAVGSDGKEINRNRLVALASAIALENSPGGIIVTDSITSDGLKKYIETQLGGKQHRFKRGYKNVINEAIRLNKEGIDCPLAIETSGHAAFRENYFLDDGAYLLTKILIKMVLLKRENKTLMSVFEDLEEPVERIELRLKIKEEDFRSYGEKVIKNLEKYAREQGWHIFLNNYEGLRVSFGKGEGDGWFLLRLSVHEPILPLNIESDTVGGVQEILSKLVPLKKEIEAITNV